MQHIFLPSAFLTVAMGACSKPYAAASNEPLTTEEASVKQVLNEDDQATISAQLRGLAVDHKPVNPPSAAPLGVRWSDVVAAAGSATGDVEMAVVRYAPVEGGWRFEIRTIEGWPGALIVTRTDDERVYDARASVGRFPDEPRYLDRAEELVAAFDQHMHLWGAKRRLPARDEAAASE